MPPALGQHIPALIIIVPGNPGIGAQPHQPVQIARIHRRQRHLLARQVANISTGLEMIDCLPMILERFAGNGEPLLNHHCGFDRGQRISLDRVRRVGPFEVLGTIEIPRPGTRLRSRSSSVLLATMAAAKVSMIQRDPIAAQMCNLKYKLFQYIMPFLSKK